MVRRFVSGLFWGSVVAFAGLAVISQVAPRPPVDDAAPGPATVDAPKDAAERPAVPDPLAQAETEDVAEAAPQPATAPPSAEPAPEPPADGEDQAADPILMAPTPPATDAPAAPVGTDAAADGLAPPPVGATPDAAPMRAGTDAEVPAVVSAEPAPAGADLPPPPPAAVGDLGADSLLIPPADVAAPQLAPDTATQTDDFAALPLADAPRSDEPAPMAPPPALQPEASDGVPKDDVPKVIEPDAADGLPGQDVPVLPLASAQPDQTGLPRIADPIGGADAAGSDPLPEAAVIDDLPPIAAFARPFENPEAKPLFAILLIDDGTPALDRASLAALPFPVTFVVDPQMDGAADAAAAYRAGLQEVAMTATGLPDGADAGDIEQSFQSNAAMLPETVAVIDLATGGFQDDRAKASAIVPILQDQGRGLVTYDRGLNAADQVARRAALPSAVVFRVLDADNESLPTMRRYLDRAAFKAAQDGKVVVIGTAHPDTVAAILAWTVEGRAASVALAPLTAVLAAP